MALPAVGLTSHRRSISRSRSATTADPLTHRRTWTHNGRQGRASDPERAAPRLASPRTAAAHPLASRAVPAMSSSMSYPYRADYNDHFETPPPGLPGCGAPARPGGASCALRQSGGGREEDELRRGWRQRRRRKKGRSARVARPVRSILLRRPDEGAAGIAGLRQGRAREARLLRRRGGRLGPRPRHAGYQPPVLGRSQGAVHRVCRRKPAGRGGGGEALLPAPAELRGAAGVLGEIDLQAGGRERGGKGRGGRTTRPTSSTWSPRRRTSTTTPKGPATGFPPSPASGSLRRPDGAGRGDPRCRRRRRVRGGRPGPHRVEPAGAPSSGRGPDGQPLQPPAEEAEEGRAGGRRGRVRGGGPAPVRPRRAPVLIPAGRVPSEVRAGGRRERRGRQTRRGGRRTGASTETATEFERRRDFKWNLPVHHRPHTAVLGSASVARLARAGRRARADPIRPAHMSSCVVILKVCSILNPSPLHVER